MRLREKRSRRSSPKMPCREGIGPQCAHKFGRLEGPERIVGMLQRYLPPTPHFATNVHFLTSEHIEVEERHGERPLDHAASLRLRRRERRNSIARAALEIDFAPAPRDRGPADG